MFFTLGRTNLVMQPKLAGTCSELVHWSYPAGILSALLSIGRDDPVPNRLHDIRDLLLPLRDDPLCSWPAGSVAHAELWGLGCLARRYAVNLCIFATWGLIYGIFCRLAIALNIDSMAAITGAGNFAGAFKGLRPRYCSPRPASCSRSAFCSFPCWRSELSRATSGARCCW